MQLFNQISSKASETFVGMFDCAFYGETGREWTIVDKHTLFCQQHKADALNECDSSGLIS